MQVKDKLYKHHRSKFVLVVRNLSITVSSVVALIAIVAIPTYISERNVSEAKAKNSTEQLQEVVEVPAEDEVVETYEGN